MGNKAKVGSKAVEKGVHPQSRKVAQFKRQALREKHAFKKTVSHMVSKINPIVERWTWFQTFLINESHIEQMNAVEIHDLVSEYLCRMDADIEKLQSERKKNRPPSAQEDRLKLVKKMEIEQASASGGGLEIPDMTDPENVSAIR
jgi:hypothetical protein